MTTTAADHHPQRPHCRRGGWSKEWERKTRRIGNLTEIFAASPLRGSGLKINRMQRHRKTSL